MTVAEVEGDVAIGTCGENFGRESRGILGLGHRRQRIVVEVQRGNVIET